MKRIFFFGLLYILSTISVNGQLSVLRNGFAGSTFSIVEYLAPDNIWLGGTDGKILKSTDRGNSWVLVTTSIPGPLSKIQFPDPLNGYCLSDKQVYYTADGGVNWSLANILNGTGSEFSVDFHIIDRNTFLRSLSDRYIQKSTDGGQSWNTTYIAPFTMKIKFLRFVDGNSGFAKVTNAFTTGMDYQSTLCKTTDGGNSWQEIKYGGEVISMQMIDKERGWFSFTIINTLMGLPKPHLDYTPDGGQTWLKTENDFNLTSLQFVNAKSGFAFRENSLLSTVDGGINWSSLYDFSFTPIAFFMFNELDGMAISKSAQIVKTIDGGKNWISIYDPVSVEENSLPAGFGLAQNYPNPFNPSTTINYTVPSAASMQNVTLRVFDVLGRNIATLVDGYKQPGNYTISFSSEKFSLPSGIYFYSLKTGNFSLTKKMILLK